jgi:hypothetical protein
VPTMDQAAYRLLSVRERAALDLLLSADFPGADELRVQAQSVRGRLWKGLAVMVELEVSDSSAPRAEVVERVPVETKVRDAWPPLELRLHVVNGFLDCIELVAADGKDPAELPNAETLEPPRINPPDLI